MAAPQTAAVLTVAELAALVDELVGNISEVLQGKAHAIRMAVVCLVAEGHLLLEDVPGVGKTSLAKALARSLDLSWQRIQFTPDLLPSDVTGASVYDRDSGTFSFRAGPVFANVVLGDEINRASPKTQSALLEAMEERQVTTDQVTRRLPSPFVVIATQNPVEHEGTYPLPESQLDRFLLRLHMGYPDRDAEIRMLGGGGAAEAIERLPIVADPPTVAAMIRAVRDVHVAPALRGYIVDLAAATRRHRAVTLGMSPRAALAVQLAARAWAAASGREYVIPDDIKSLLGPVLAHRLVLSADAGVSGVTVEEVLADVVRTVPVPLPGAL